MNEDGWRRSNRRFIITMMSEECEELETPVHGEAFKIHLIGQACERLLCQQYYFDGELLDEANVLFLGLASGAWVRFFYDSGKFFWRDEAIPSLPSITHPTDQYHYPITELTESFGITACKITQVAFRKIANGWQLRIWFRNGARLELENGDDRSRVFLRNEFRITKYDPTNRDRSGAYLADEWISKSQIGRSFGGVNLTPTEYQRTEDAYITAAMAFVQESGGDSLRIIALENHQGYEETGLQLQNGVTLHRTEVGRVCRLILQEKFWCRLEDDAGRFIHFGWDYYMYVGVTAPCDHAKALAESLGLFVEALPSPHHAT
jgi:hypothetical protein